MRSGKFQRRQVLHYLAAGAAGLTAGSHGRTARAAAASHGEATRPDLYVIDFHRHFVGPAFTPVAGAAAPRQPRAHATERYGARALATIGGRAHAITECRNSQGNRSGY